MMERPVGVVLVISIVALGSVPANAVAARTAAAQNEAPLPDAGLDQQVTFGSSVRLDATGSRDPDGEITGYEWRIEGPNGTTTRPDCASCGQTTFQPRSVGTYNVTVTVTDDDGVTRSDTLYVNVTAGEGPSVSLTGPTNPTVRTEQVYTASVSAGDQPVERVSWFVGDRRVSRSAGGNETASTAIRFGSTDETAISVRVTDEAGKTAVSNLTVTPQNASAASSSSGGGDDKHPVGKYIPQKHIWIRGDVTDTVQDAVAYAKRGGQSLEPGEEGGLNVDDEIPDQDNNPSNQGADSHTDINEGGDTSTGLTDMTNTIVDVIL